MAGSAGWAPPPFNLNQCLTANDARDPSALISSISTPGAEGCHYTEKSYSGSTFRFALDYAGTFGLKTHGSVTFSANRFDGNVTANTNLDRFSTRSQERQASVGSYRNSIYTARHPMGALSRMSTINKKSLTETDTPRELRRYRQLYQVYPRIWQSVTAKSLEASGFTAMLPLAHLPLSSIRESLTAESQNGETVSPQLIHRLSFTHLSELIQLPDDTQRRFYELECIRGNWSVRDRLFEEITPSEVQLVAKYLAQNHLMTLGNDEHLRAVLDFFDLKRLTTQVGSSVLDILNKDFPHVDAALESVSQKALK